MGAPPNWKGNRKSDERKKTATTIEGGSEAKKTREGGKVTVNYSNPAGKENHMGKKNPNKHKKKTPEGIALC